MSWSEGEFDFDRALRRYLTKEDLHDMDDALDANMSSGLGVAGAIVVRAAESVQRVREPLSDDAKENFGRYAIEALRHADRYLDPEDRL